MYRQGGGQKCLARLPADSILRTPWWCACRNDRIGHALKISCCILHFQGVFHTAGQLALSHLEVLVRILDAETPGGLIMPGHFIPYAEKSGKFWT